MNVSIEREEDPKRQITHLFTLQYKMKPCLKDIKFANITLNGLSNVVLLSRTNFTLRLKELYSYALFAKIIK